MEDRLVANLVVGFFRGMENPGDSMFLVVAGLSMPSGGGGIESKLRLVTCRGGPLLVSIERNFCAGIVRGDCQRGSLSGFETRGVL